MYVWTDSSPQGGVDWLLSIVSMISAKDLVSCSEAADYLSKSVDEFRTAVHSDKKEKQIEIALKRHECGEILSQQIRLHRQLPMALGSGRSSLEHKLKCILRKFWAETQSLSRLKTALTFVTSMTTDLGTESGLPDIEGLKLEDVLPEWSFETELYSEDVDPALVPEQGVGHMFPRSLLCPGILHVCDNMVKEMDACLSGWNEWIVGFKCLSHLLHHDHLRRRLVGLCIMNTPFEWLKESFNKGCPKPISWRWENVVQILPHILDCQFALQTVWRPDKFMQRGGEEGSALHESDSQLLNIEALTGAIESGKWWFFSHMILTLHLFSKEFSSWAEGCACHGWLRPSKPSNFSRRGRSELSEEAKQLESARKMLGVNAASTDGPRYLCPLAGRRAPELASGRMQQHLEMLSLSYLQDLLRACPPGVEPAHAQEVLADFTLGKSSLMEILSQKLQCWTVLPWKLASLGLESQDHARQWAANCLQDFTQAPQDPSLHHRLSWQHLQAGAEVRRQLEAFISGSCLSELPSLNRLVLELKFLPVVERVQEGDHSIISRMIGHKTCNGPYVSCCLRMPEVKELFDKQAQYDVFLGKFAEVKDIDNLAKRMGFHKHSLWQEACHEKRHKRGKEQLASSFLYALDPETQFQDLSHAKKTREKKAREKKDREKKWLDHFQGPQKFSLDGVERHAMADHLQRELQIGRLYSCPTQAAALPTLQTAIGPMHSRQVHLGSRPAVCDLALSSEEASAMVSDLVPFGQLQAETRIDEAGPRCVFWRLTCAHPSRRKLVRLPAASGQRLGPTDLSITLHKSVRTATACFVEVEPAVAEGLRMPIAVLSALRADIECMRHGLLAWSTVKALTFSVEGCAHLMSEELQSLLCDMVTVGAFPIINNPHNLTLRVRPHEAERLRCMETLRSNDVVEVGEQKSEFLGFRFTASGILRLRHMHQCQDPVEVFRPAEALAELEDEDFQDLTPWEMFTLLRHRGWQLKRAPEPKKLKQHPLPPHTLELHRMRHCVWYLRSVHIEKSKPYMQALLMCQSLFDHGELEELHHCQSVKYYEQIIAGTSTGLLPVLDKQAGQLQTLALDVDSQDVPPTGSKRPMDIASQASRKAAQELLSFASLEDIPVTHEPHTSDSDALSLAEASSETKDGNDLDADGVEEQPLPQGEVVPVEQVDTKQATPTTAPSPSELPCAVEAKRSRAIHPNTFMWGPFRFTYASRAPHGAWQVTCPYHKLSSKTRCTRSMKLGDKPEARDICVRALMNWCLQAPQYRTKKAHASMPCRVEDVLDQGILDARLLSLEEPPAVVRTDKEIEEEEASEEQSDAPEPDTKRRRVDRAAAP